MLAETVRELQSETLGTWGSVLAHGGDVALLDFPSYQNAGDTLIYLGERRYLRDLAVNVRYLTDHARYRKEDLQRLHPTGPLLIRGGGNLGDRWPLMQAFRERIVDDFPERQIIQLPQSMDFSTTKGQTAARRSFAKHTNLTLMIRDHVSLDQAQKLFPENNIVFSPDAAFGIGLQEQKGPSPLPVVKILRSDSEREPIGLESLGGPTLDWGLSGKSALAWKAARVPQSVTRRVPELSRPLYSLVVAGYGLQAQLNLLQANKAVQSGEIVITDRLHAAVLAALHGKETYVADNAYGKISRIYESYLHRFSNVHLVTSAKDVAKLLAL